MIKLTGISKTFGKGSPNEKRLLNKFNLEISKNDFILLIGGNGSGKSTLLNIIAGEVPIDEGSIFFNERSRKVVFNFTTNQYFISLLRKLPLNKANFLLLGSFVKSDPAL